MKCAEKFPCFVYEAPASVVGEAMSVACASGDTIAFLSVEFLMNIRADGCLGEDWSAETTAFIEGILDQIPKSECRGEILLRERTDVPLG